MGPRAELNADRGTVHLQRFTIGYEYPVHFTERVFDPANPVLVEVLARHEPERRHRCVVFVDDGVLDARPGVVEEIGG
jgi:3-dehydroquinate synthase